MDSTRQTTNLPDIVGSLLEQVRLASVLNNVGEFGLPNEEQFCTNYDDRTESHEQQFFVK